ncbi:MAG: glycosyltransferase family 39 protein, partial [Anaerolineales bacterium]|nr:glycosyltransferase family 39 protein [Anaerolineales bacterium]
MRSRFVVAAVAILAAVVLITYQSALRLNFYGDDYSFLELAGRSTLAQYLAFYFDPRLQTGWYRPIQGMLFGVEWCLFGGNPVGYHLVNVLVHLANCWLLFALVARVTRKWRAAFLSALIYAGLPLISIAVFWPGDADFLLTLFYLCALWAWMAYLQQRARRFFVAAFVFFLLALTTKEFGVTLPIILFLADRLLGREKTSLSALARRYAPFAIVYLFYLPLEFYIQSRSVLTNTYGYRVAEHVISNFTRYLAALAFPWGLSSPLDFIWLAVAIFLLGYFFLAKRDVRLLFLCLAAILAFLLVTPFPWFFT